MIKWVRLAHGNMDQGVDALISMGFPGQTGNFVLERIRRQTHGHRRNHLQVFQAADGAVMLPPVSAICECIPEVSAWLRPPAYSYPRVIHGSEGCPQGLLTAATISQPFGLRVPPTQRVARQ